MKKLFFLLIIYFIAGISQCYSGIIHDSIIDGDKLLSKIQNLLPAGWSFLNYENNALVIQREELVYILYENRINAPVSMETRDEVDKRIKENGKLKRAMYIFGFSPILSGEEIGVIKNHNDSIQQIINSLPEKFKIKHLLDKFSLSKGEEIYMWTTNEEKERVENYRIAMSNLISKFLRLPDYNSEKYSLYIDLTVGIEDQLHLVYPYEVSMEMYKIKELLNDNLVKVK